MNTSVKYEGTSTWAKIDTKAFNETGEIKLTGEVIETDNVTKRIPRSGFDITYCLHLQELFDLLGGQKYKVASYIMKNRAKENNILVTTIQELAEKVNVSVQTVLNTLQRLESGGLISRKTGSILVNAKLIHRGDAKKERYLLQKFECFDEKRKEKQNIKQLNKPTQINFERSII